MAKFCSSRCGTAYRNSQRYEGKIEGYDYIHCPVCNQKVSEVTVAHARMHGFDNVRLMSEHYGLPNLKCERIIEKMKGSNNPGYQHGGKLSPWSKKNPSLSEEQLRKNILNAEKKRKGTRPNEKQSWIRKGYSKEEAIELVRNRQQTFTLEKCIQKYGNKRGLERWKQRQEKWQETLDSKPDHEKQDINRRKLSNGYSISRKEIALYSELKQFFPELEIQKYIKYEGKGYSYDFYLDNKIIEFYGDFWHHNPRIYKEDWVNPYSKLTSVEKWETDRKREEVAVSLGFEIKVVWELDWSNDKDKVIKECINFLKQ